MRPLVQSTIGEVTVDKIKTSLRSLFKPRHSSGDWTHDRHDYTDLARQDLTTHNGPWNGMPLSTMSRTHLVKATTQNHKEPDSLDRLDDDIVERRCDIWVHDTPRH